MAFEYLENIGEAKKNLQLEPNSVFQQIVKDFAEDMVQTAKDELVKGTPPRNATGSLAQSISFTIDLDQVVTIDFLMNDYWDFINSGVDGVERSGQAVENEFGTAYSFKTINPSQDMVDSYAGTGGLEGWMKAKSITQLVYTDKNGDTITESLVSDSDFRQAAFVLARATKRFGIKANEFVNDTFTEEKLVEFEQAIFDAINNIL